MRVIGKSGSHFVGKEFGIQFRVHLLFLCFSLSYIQFQVFCKFNSKKLCSPFKRLIRILNEKVKYKLR